MTRTALLLAAAIAAASACKHSPAKSVDAGVDASTPSALAVIARAEDQRRAKDVPQSAGTDHEVALRRRAAEALARIADPASEDALLRALSDEDEQTAGWGAYALGWTCKGREEAHVRALSARAQSLDDEAPRAPARGAIDARMALARAIGRCGGPLAEQVLTAWVRARGAWASRAALALGDVALRRGQLDDETTGALLDAASAGGGPPLDAALYPFARAPHVSDAFAARLVSAASDALTRASPERAFALRALGRAGHDAAPVLVRAIESKDLSASERAEAARAIGQLGDAGHAAAAEALGQLTPDKDPLAITALGGDAYAVLLPLIGAVGDDPPKRAEPALYALAGLRPPGEVPPSLARRLAALRCAAAAALARGAYDAQIIRQCDADPSSEASERARLVALLRRPLVADRRAAWKALATSAHLKVREAALEGIAGHAELAEVARAMLAGALASDKPGLVATAAELIHAHPERALALAESERRAALDPNAPPPTANPAREVDRDVAAALKGALDRSWAEDLVETRLGLMEAAVATRLPAARDAALRACHDGNATMRDHALKALRALGEPSPLCPPPDPPPTDAATPPVLVTHDTKVTLSTDAGDLALVFEPLLAPVAVTRFVELARGGFYKGIVVHRVVPGFVAQFGDPGGDGYGGSGKLLRCETSPVPFDRLDVGVALAGRDTGSSQLFVTLARVPHLDGEYTRVGRAEGDWDALTEGDVIQDVKVEDAAPR